MAYFAEGLFNAGLQFGWASIVYVVPFLFVLTFVVFFHELGHFLVARRCGVAVETFSIGFGRSILSWTDRKGTVWKVGWLPLGGYVKFLGDDGAASTPDRAKLDDMQRQARQSGSSLSGVFHFKPLYQRAAVVAAGPVANFILAIVIFAGLFMIVGEEVIPPIVGSVIEGNPAAVAGIKAGDVVTRVDGRKITSFGDIKESVGVNAGVPLQVSVERNGYAFKFTITPATTVIKDQFGNTQEIGLLGIRPVDDPSKVEHVRYDPFTAVLKAVEKVDFIVRQTVLYLKRLVIGQADPTQVSGFIGIAKMSGEMAQISLAAVFYLVGFLSVSIGFINLVPIPMLDGGHLLYYAYEAVRGRPMGEKAQELGFRLGLVLVISLMVFATWNDLVKLRPQGSSDTEETR